MRYLHPAKILVLGYLFYSIVGCFLLSLPFCHQEPVTMFDDYFTAISAVSTTGLATIDIGVKYNFLGQFVILLLIQLGGVGYMTFSSFVLLCTAGKISAYRRKIGASTFSFPKDFSMREFIFSVVIFSLICETIGAVALSFVFFLTKTPHFIWNGIFHSISAFCTAGFSTFPDEFSSFRDHLGLNLVISGLSLLGSLGFIVALDFYKKWTRQKETITFTTKVILATTCAFLVVGTAMFFFLETIQDGRTLFDEWLVAFFQVTTAMTTTGFNTIDIGTLTAPMLILLAFLATFGAAPSGTGGGLKNTAFASLVAIVKSTLQGTPTSLWRHEIPSQPVKIATVAFIYYVFCLTVSLFVLSCSEKVPFLDLLFETTNALNNTGLSTGLTSHLSDFAKSFYCLLMLMGRVGVLTFGVAISSQDPGKELKGRAELIT